MPLNNEKNFDERPHRYELIDASGRPIAEGSSASELAIIATSVFPNQEQDPDRAGTNNIPERLDEYRANLRAGPLGGRRNTTNFGQG